MGHGVAFTLGYLSGLALVSGIFTAIVVVFGKGIGKPLNRVQIIFTFFVTAGLLLAAIWYHRHFVSN